MLVFIWSLYRLFIFDLQLLIPDNPLVSFLLDADDNQQFIKLLNKWHPHTHSEVYMDIFTPNNTTILYI
jgi:hypothetical protein